MAQAPDQGLLLVADALPQARAGGHLPTPTRRDLPDVRPLADQWFSPSQSEGSLWLTDLITLPCWAYIPEHPEPVRLVALEPGHAYYERPLPGGGRQRLMINAAYVRLKLDPDPGAPTEGAEPC